VVQILTAKAVLTFTPKAVQILTAKAVQILTAKATSDAVAEEHTVGHCLPLLHHHNVRRLLQTHVSQAHVSQAHVSVRVARPAIASGTRAHLQHAEPVGESDDGARAGRDEFVDGWGRGRGGWGGGWGGLGNGNVMCLLLLVMQQFDANDGAANVIAAIKTLTMMPQTTPLQPRFT
jgi:hypothetical protein